MRSGGYSSARRGRRRVCPCLDPPVQSRPSPSRHRRIPMPKRFRSRAVAFVFAAFAIAGCAGSARTSLETSWVNPKFQGAKFKKVLIVSVAADEFAQQYFQDDMAAALRKRGMMAVASERFFTHLSPAEERRFKQAVAQSGADAVLLARVVGVEIGRAHV